jgi:hypothetical protein
MSGGSLRHNVPRPDRLFSLPVRDSRSADSMTDKRPIDVKRMHRAALSFHSRTARPQASVLADEVHHPELPFHHSSGRWPDKVIASIWEGTAYMHYEPLQ